MFNVKAVVREIEAEENLNNEHSPRAKRANPANVSHFSRFSQLSPVENENIRKLEALKILYGEQDSVPLTDHELAEHKINGLRLREDREFVYQKLKGTYGEKRLTLVIQYFDEWQKGSDAETNVNKIENAGRYRANTWLLEKRTFVK